MKKSNGFFNVMVLIYIVLLLVACNDNPDNHSDNKENPTALQKVEGVKGFSTINGYKVEEGKFYFSATKKNEWNFYSLDLETQVLEKSHEEAGEYDLYIPIEEESAVYVDLEGQLFYRVGEEEKKIDEEIVGLHRPNLLISPNKTAVLYTKGSREKADLYLYYLDQDQSKLIKENIGEDAFQTFSFTTQWSHKTNYFIFYNSEIYDDEGKYYSTLEATTAKWAPDDKYIVYIRKPQEKEEVLIGDWRTYIGTELALLQIEEKEDKTIYENPMGLVDPIDSIQWSKDASKVSISTGEIIKAPHGEIEAVKYQEVFVYNLDSEKGILVENMPYNYYEILFDNYLYGSSLGKRDALELVEIYGKDRKVYENPVLLNSQDMFVISHEKEAFFLDGEKLIRRSREGKEEVVLSIPWEVNEIYFDKKTKKIIITSREVALYLFKLEEREES
ncbi:hypothetical protein CACET_c37360 [Clostridium aceticum]|uniref:Uncharacterized protein n=1 Tax=Clostridium aceticum TaxID=84022 RepID=A0A0D8I838_9CLOT|nr:hypothetical protein [Clostridium aceticum]AKL97164.1 hypothetical protein CACET_c37360 [Clostridium aceticum]KJF26202.1 hypothetical protein TZ02_13530 [Clostridium aceticum]